MLIVIGLWTFLRVMFCGSATIALENLALRHQLAVLQRSDRRPRLASPGLPAVLALAVHRDPTGPNAA
jgi:hypothetical protein